ncbi:MAG: DUF2769 domain-containing protein [Methanobacterium sp.]|nr:DUF2769 domain-containing protein [Methanobacterium sp.]
MIEIPFEKEKIFKCLCTTCPVQEKSNCSKEKMLKLQEILQNEKEPIKPQNFPGMYCTNGKAVCGDINTEKNCICDRCSVYTDFNLAEAEPSFLYCKDGHAK